MLIIININREDQIKLGDLKELCYYSVNFPGIYMEIEIVDILGAMNEIMGILGNFKYLN